MEIKDNKTNIMKRGAVTFLDVVGWMGIYKRRKDAIFDLLELIQKLQKSADEYTDKEILKLNRSDPQRGLEVKTLVKSISDTIVFLTTLEPEYSLKIHGELSSEAISISLQNGIPLRGATSFGEYNYKENIMIGPAVDEAASWHEHIEWFGCILTPSAFLLNRHSNMNCWKTYKAPAKSGYIKTACANWASNYKHGRDHLCGKLIELGPIIPEIEKKYSNTLAYFDHCNKSSKKTP